MFFAGGVVGCGGILGFLTLFAANYNPDDYPFFHRAIVQLDCMDRPFLLTETGVHPGDLPQISILHAMTSYEPAVAFTARLLHADPLGLYQNGCALLGIVLLTVVLSLLYREFRLGPWMALVATLAAVLYLMIDVRLPRSYGAILVSCWTGKVILWATLMPWSIVLASAFLRRPCVSRWVPLFLAGVCAPGLSGSGLFLFPVEVLCVSVAYLLQASPSWKRIRRAALVNTGSLYCAAIAVSALTGAISPPSNIDVWIQGWPAEWWTNLGLVFSSGDVVIRDALLIFLVPWFALPRSAARLAVFLGIAVVLIVANPLAGPIWIRIVKPGAYWRFVFLLPMAWYAGLVASALLRKHGSGLFTAGSRGVAMAAMACVIIAGRHSLLWPSRVASDLHIKSPWELRLPHDDVEFARLAIPHLHDRHILGPQDVCISIALLDPAARFDAVRGTDHCFTNAGQPAEGRRRIAAQKAVTSGDEETDSVMGPGASVKESLDRGVDAIILIDSEPVRRLVIPQLGGSESAAWKPSVAGCGYALFLRTKE